MLARAQCDFGAPSDAATYMTAHGAYLVGRDAGEWPVAASSATDQLFAAIRRDDMTLQGLTFEHCTFANVSFKASQLRGCRFVDCAFLNCYFRKTLLTGSAFVGCKFVGCDFPRLVIQSCDFKYSRFEDCALPFEEMAHSLPPEANLREELARRLAIASDSLGLQADGRRYRLAAIQAAEAHLCAAVSSDSEWYQSHFAGTRRLRALGRLLASRFNAVLWGHGERWLPLIRNLLILALVVFPAVLWVARDGLLGPSGPPRIAEVVWLSVTTILPVDGVPSVVATRWSTRGVLALESFLGLVAGGLVVTLLARRMLKR